MDLIVGSDFVLRPLVAADAPAVAAYRSAVPEPGWQSWTVPYPEDRAAEMIATLPDGPTEGEWYSFGIADRGDGPLLGDVAVHVGWDAHEIELGYTLAPEAQGRGLATRAVDAVIEHLVATTAVSRFRASLHPDNVRSAMVLERLGFVYEGTDRQSFWVDGHCSDDARYGMLVDEWRAWRARPRQPFDRICLVPITPDNARAYQRMRTHRSQERLVAPVLQSFADACVPDIHNGYPIVPWMRGIEGDGEPIGFVMMVEATEHHPTPYLWRLLVDRWHQRRGVGVRVLDDIVTMLRSAGHHRMTLSYHPGDGSPAAFYHAYGLRPTGRISDGEVEAAIEF